MRQYLISRFMAMGMTLEEASRVQGISETVCLREKEKTREGQTVCVCVCVCVSGRRAHCTHEPGCYTDLLAG
jgi:hypothetical protein